MKRRNRFDDAELKYKRKEKSDGLHDGGKRGISNDEVGVRMARVRSQKD